MIINSQMAATTSPRLCTKCMQMATPMQDTTATITTTSSSLQMSSNLHKCTCQNLVTPSSSDSTISEKGDIQLKLNFKPMKIMAQSKNKPDNPKAHRHRQQQVIVVPKLLPRPERLQPYTSTTSQQFLTPNSLTITDTYYSCSSEGSECDKNQIPFKNPGKLSENTKEHDNNFVILQLLHEVVHLIKEDNHIREEAFRLIQEKPSSHRCITTQTNESVCVPLNHSETSNTQSSSARTISETAIKEQDFEKDLKEQNESNFTSGQQQQPPQLTLPCWTPCLCYLHGIAAAEGRARAIPFPIGNTNLEYPNNFVQGQSIAMNFPMDATVSKTKNFASPFPDIVEMPQDFVYQETEVYYDECCDDEIKPDANEQTKSGIQMYKEEKYAETTLDAVKCICPKQNDVCPKHGPLENLFKPKSSSCPEDEVCELNAAVTENKAFCTCPTKEDECPIHGRVIKSGKYSIERDADDELYSRSQSNKTFNPDNVNLHDGKQSKPIHLPEENDHEESPSRYINENHNDSNDAPNLNHEKLVDNGNLFKTVEDKVPSKQPSVVVENQINRPTVNHEIPQIITAVEEIENSPYIIRTSATTGRNIYNFLPALDRGEIEKDEYYAQVGRYEHEEVDSADDYYYPDYECEELEAECELAKERNAERRKKKKRDKNDEGKRGSPKLNENISMALATLQQLEGVGSPEEMKFFIDSLILDLDAMEHARRKTAIEKNLRMPRPGMCPRESFPVTITDVTDLGTTSLYVKWIIHDCSGIGGYEIYTDGYLTNRYFHCQHEAAVITNVDITLPHKIALVAQTSTDDASIELMCSRGKNKQNRKCLPWKTDLGKETNSSPASISALWIPSIYLYDPAICRATAAPPIMRGSI